MSSDNCLLISLLEMGGLAMINVVWAWGNWHSWRILFKNANRELKWPILCNILGLLLGARLWPWFEQFRAVFSFQIGPFLKMNGPTVILRKYCRNVKNWHSWRILFTNANRGLKLPIFRNILGIALEARCWPQFEQFRAGFSFQSGPFLEMNGLARILRKCCPGQGNRHSRRILFTSANRDIKWPIFVTL